MPIVARRASCGQWHSSLHKRLLSRVPLVSEETPCTHSATSPPKEVEPLFGTGRSSKPPHVPPTGPATFSIESEQLLVALTMSSTFRYSREGEGCGGGGCCISCKQMGEGLFLIHLMHSCAQGRGLSNIMAYRPSNIRKEEQKCRRYHSRKAVRGKGACTCTSSWERRTKNEFCKSKPTLFALAGIDGRPG